MKFTTRVSRLETRDVPWGSRCNNSWDLPRGRMWYGSRQLRNAYLPWWCYGFFRGGGGDQPTPFFFLVVGGGEPTHQIRLLPKKPKNSRLSNFSYWNFERIFGGSKISSIGSKNTLPKTNSWPLKLREIHLPTIHFQGLCLFQGGYIIVDLPSISLV